MILHDMSEAETLFETNGESVPGAGMGCTQLTPMGVLLINTEADVHSDDM